MTLVIIGTTKTTEKCIEALVSHGYSVSGVISLDESIKHKKARYIDLSLVCNKYNIKLIKTKNINYPEIIKEIRDMKPDIIIECGWSQLISKEILEIPKISCIGLHYSLLPKNQGGASLNWALINDEKEWGVSLFHLEEKVDSGDIIAQKKISIDEKDDINSLYDKADNAAISLLIENIPLLIKGVANRIKQDKSKTTYLPARKPEEGRINWNKTPREIYNLIRALTSPYPGAFTFIGNKKVKILRSKISETKISESIKPGTIIDIRDSGLIVKCKEGTLLVDKIEIDNQIFENNFRMIRGFKRNDKFN